MPGRTIFKYELKFTDEPTVITAPVLEILDVHMQGSRMFVWIEVDDGPSERLRFWVIGTGHPIPDGAVDHVDTVHLEDQGLVFHIYTERFWTDSDRWDKDERPGARGYSLPAGQPIIYDEVTRSLR